MHLSLREEAEWSMDKAVFVVEGDLFRSEIDRTHQGVVEFARTRAWPPFLRRDLISRYRTQIRMPELST